jgi:hypothetical protein
VWVKMRHGKLGPYIMEFQTPQLRQSTNISRHTLSSHDLVCRVYFLTSLFSILQLPAFLLKLRIIIYYVCISGLLLFSKPILLPGRPQLKREFVHVGVGVMSLHQQNVGT